MTSAPVTLPEPSARRAHLVTLITALSPALGALCDVFDDNITDISNLPDEKYAGVVGYIGPSGEIADGPARAAAVATTKGLISVGPMILDSLVAFAPRPVARSAANKGPAEVTRADNVFNVIGARLWSAFLAMDLSDLPAAAEVAPADHVLTGDPVPAALMERITSADPSVRLSGLSAITAARVKIPDGAGAQYMATGADGAGVGSNAVDKDGKVKTVSGGLAFVFEAHRPAPKAKAPATAAPAAPATAAPAAPATAAEVAGPVAEVAPAPAAE